MAGKKLNRKSPKCTTAETPIWGGNIEKFEEFMDDAINNKLYDINSTIMRHLSYNYGSAYGDILKYGEEDCEWIKPIPGSKEVLKAEVLHGVREEMALKLSDIVLRRTDAGTARNPGEAFLKEATQIMGKELSWDESKKKQEIEEVKNIYIPA